MCSYTHSYTHSYITLGTHTNIQIQTHTGIGRKQAGWVARLLNSCMSSVQTLYKRSLELFMQYFKVIVNCYMDSFGHVLCKCCPNIVSAKYCANIVPIMCKYCVNIVQILCKCTDYFYWVNLRGRSIYINRCIKMDTLYVST